MLAALFTAGIAVAGVLAGASSATATPAVPTAAAGPWQPARTVDLPTALNRGGPSGSVTAIACPSAGNCTAVGQYTNQNEPEAFAVNEVNHTWQTAVVPIGTSGTGISDPQLLSVSCASAGNCTASGVVTINDAYTEAVSTIETNGA